MVLFLIEDRRLIHTGRYQVGSQCSCIYGILCCCIAGAHPNTQKAAVQLLQQHLGAAAAGKLTSGLSHLVGRNQDVLELMGSRATEQGGEVWSEKGEGSLRGRAYEAMALLAVRRSQG